MLFDVYWISDQQTIPSLDGKPINPRSMTLQIASVAEQFAHEDEEFPPSAVQIAHLPEQFAPIDE
nr:hypothetical protein [uncultured Acetobacteroides sp.]